MDLYGAAGPLLEVYGNYFFWLKLYYLHKIKSSRIWQNYASNT